MNIITVTLNPAYDIHCTVTDFVPFAENYAEAVSRSCGGKGINISKMLNELSVSNEACIVLGRENAAYFEEYLKNYRGKKFYTNGAIRENITVHSPGKKETRISADSFSVSPKLFSEVSDYILSRSGSGAIVAFSGRLPRGVEKNAVLKFFERLQNSGALLSLDSNSFSAEELIRLKPWFIKPNEQELASLWRISSPEDELRCAERLHKSGIANVMLSLGERGCVFSGGGKLLRIEVPQVSVKSTIGAGDSAVAGFIGAYSRGALLSECARFAAACGTAACTESGTDIPNRETVYKIYGETTVRECEVDEK